MERAYLLIPWDIWTLPITITERVVLSEIVSLSKVGICYASNAHFAELCQVTQSAARKAIYKLIAGGYVTAGGATHGHGNARTLCPCTATPLPLEGHPPAPPVPATMYTVNKTTTKTGRKPKGLDEVLDAFRELGHEAEGEQFYNYYEANGWIQGKARKPLANWRAAAANWIRNTEKYANEKKPRGYQAPKWDADGLKAWAAK
mgnify:CR=1 FL=1